eukprot:3329097-Amphidinium_carterae.1
MPSTSAWTLHPLVEVGHAGTHPRSWQSRNSHTRTCRYPRASCAVALPSHPWCMKDTCRDGWPGCIPIAHLQTHLRPSLADSPCTGPSGAWSHKVSVTATWSLRSTPVEQPPREWPQDEDIFSALDSTCNNCADCGICALVNIEVKDHRRERLAL